LNYIKNKKNKTINTKNSTLRSCFHKIEMDNISKKLRIIKNIIKNNLLATSSIE